MVHTIMASITHHIVTLPFTQHFFKNMNMCTLFKKCHTNDGVTRVVIPDTHVERVGTRHMK